MTEDEKRLLAVLEVRVRDLMAKCDVQRHRINELHLALDKKEDEIQQTKQTIEQLNTRYDNILTAHAVSLDEGDIKNARMRLSKLVREVDKCIALLNE